MPAVSKELLLDFEERGGGEESVRSGLMAYSLPLDVELIGDLLESSLQFSRRAVWCSQQDFYVETAREQHFVVVEEGGLLFRQIPQGDAFQQVSEVVSGGEGEPGDSWIRYQSRRRQQFTEYCCWDSVLLKQWIF